MNRTLYFLHYAGRIMIWAKQHKAEFWFPLSTSWDFDGGLFRQFDFRINGTVYTDWSDEFKAALFWELLKQ